MTQQPAPLATSRSAFGSFLILRAIPAAALAVVITFSADHSSIVGELAFMVFGFVMAPVFVLTAFASGFTGRVRSTYVVSAAAAIVSAAVMAIVIAPVNESPAESLRAFTLVVGIWAAIAGVSELLAGWFHPVRSESREMLMLGGFTAVLAVVELLIPLNDVYAVGMLGAYGAIVAVFAVIAGLSLRFVAKSSEKGQS